MKKMIIVAMMVLTAAAVHAGLYLTVTGEAMNSNLGYTPGQTVSLVFQINPSFVNNPSCSFRNDYEFMNLQNQWVRLDTIGPSLFSSVSGTALSGSYTSPVDPFYGETINVMSTVRGMDEKAITQMVFAVNSVTGIGLTAPNANTIKSIGVGFDELPVEYIFSGSYTDPVEYFSNYYGTYTFSFDPKVGAMNMTDSTDTMAIFMPTSATFSSSPIPEPASALMIGFGGLLIVGCRRILKLYSRF